MIETWYVMADGSVGDPAEISPDASGLLKHKDGRAVAYGEHGPLSRGDVDAEEERKRTKNKPHAKDMKPEDSKSSYKTRETKAD